METNPEDRIDYVTHVLLYSAGILKCHVTDIPTLEKDSRAKLEAPKHHLGHFYKLLF